MHWMTVSDGHCAKLQESRSPSESVSLSKQDALVDQKGESVTIEIHFTLDLPDKEGRWGHREGITYLTHALPIFSYPRSLSAILLDRKGRFKKLQQLTPN